MSTPYGIAALVTLFSISSIVLVTPSTANNVCYVEQAGCKYRVTVLPTSTCPTLSSGFSNDQASELDGTANRMGSSTATDVTSGGNGGQVVNEVIDPVKKLENLEIKLLKMVEELSVRSLRHIREIRSDLRQMAASVNSLKSSGRSGLVTRGTGSDGSIAGSSGGSRGSMSTGGVMKLTPCPPEFIGVGTWRSCYRFSNFEASWHEAREYCSAFGANLISIDTMKEAYIVDYLIKSHTEYQEPKGWWTSGSYVVRSQRWMWTETNQLRPIGAFSRWAPGEPNARSTMHCMVLYKPAKYHWHDATCTDKHTFVCEMDYY